LRASDLVVSLVDGTLPAALAVPTEEGSLVQVLDRAGHVVAASNNIAGEPPISALAPGAGGSVARTVSGLPVGNGMFRLVALAAKRGNVSYTVYVANSLGPVDQATSTLTRLLATSIPILLVIVALTTWLIVGRALRPVESIRREVEAITTEGLDRRVPEPSTDDEIGRLARTMNRMLQRLENATGRQRRFVADASHELRSPLTGMRTQLEVDLTHPARADWPRTARDVLDETIRMQRLVDDLLLLARADNDTLVAPHGRVDLDDIVIAEAHRIAVHFPHRLEVAAAGEGVIDGDPDQLAQLVRNLLDNAARYATRRITVSVSDGTGSVVLSVADDGPGIPEADRARVFERFTRLDGARARDDGGSGLGLAIAREIAGSHHATITVDDDGPGARFTVTFPAADGATV
jgi:signal transduction histidine kinase